MMKCTRILTCINFRYDSTHTGYHRNPDITIEEKDGKLVVNGQSISVYSEKDPKSIPWAEAGKSSYNT